MRENLRAYLKHTKDVLMVVATFIIAFDLSNIEFESERSKKHLQIKEDCARWSANAFTSEELADKYKLYGNQESTDTANTSAASFCQYYDQVLSTTFTVGHPKAY